MGNLATMEAPAGPTQGRAALVLLPPGGSLALRLVVPFHLSGQRPYTWLVRLSATVRLHASVGKKDGHAFTPNEEMKLDCQDLSGLVLTRCRLF